MRRKIWLGSAAFIAVLAALFAGFFALRCGASAPQLTEAKAYRVLILGDLHYDGLEFHEPNANGVGNTPEQRRNIAMWKSRSPQLLAAARHRAKAAGAIAGFQLGDLVQGDAVEAKTATQMLLAGYRTVIADFPELPVYLVKGNHDVRIQHEKRAVGNAAYRRAFGGETPPGCGNYALKLGPDLFVVIDGFDAANPPAPFVRRTLEQNPDARYVVLLSHLPLLPASPKFPTPPGSTEILALLANRPALILAAHTHRSSLGVRTTKQGETPQLVVSSMGSAWQPELLKPGRVGSYAALSKSPAPELVHKFREFDAGGQYRFRQLFDNSGFVILELSERGVDASYYTNNVAKPSAKIRLIAAPRP